MPSYVLPANAPLRLALQMTEAVQICHAINASQSREVHQDNLQEPAGVARFSAETLALKVCRQDGFRRPKLELRESVRGLSMKLGHTRDAMQPRQRVDGWMRRGRTETSLCFPAFMDG